MRKRGGSVMPNLKFTTKPAQLIELWKQDGPLFDAL
jgi:hypothetical protein